MKRLQALSLSHKTAPVAVRERVRLSLEAAARLKADEIFVLNTCNRSEIYWVGLEAAQVLSLLRLETGLDEASLRSHFSYFEGEAALTHLMRVACGLESLVVGEIQILGQLKEAYRLCCEHGLPGLYLNKALHRAFRAAKRVHSETGLGRYPISVASEAVELASHIFGSIEKSQVLLIGAGDMAGLAANRLKERGVREICILNRTYQNACTLASELEGRPAAFDCLEDELGSCDIVIASAGADEPIITSALMQAVMRRRKNRPLFMIDIALPRNIEAQVGQLYNCFVYDLDALQSIVEKNRCCRASEIECAEGLIAEEVAAYAHWLKGLDASATITELYALSERYIADQLEELAPAERAEMEAALGLLARRLLHLPVSFLKDHPDTQNIDLLRRIFKLDEDYQDRYARQRPCNGSGR